MDFQNGERVFLNFDTGGVEKTAQNASSQSGFPSFVGDIQERHTSTPNPPLAPFAQGNTTGFPAHKKRTPRPSAFKQQRAAKEKADAAAASKPQSSAPRAQNDREKERRAIDEENRQKLAAMSEREIEQEREELLSSLSPALIQKLLMRSNLDDGSNERDLYPEEHGTPPSKTEDATAVADSQSKSTTSKKVSFAEDVEDAAPLAQQQVTPTTAPSTATPHPQPQTEDQNSPLETSISTSPSIHFPAVPKPPTLDPSSPTFLASLHSKYFPDLPYDPSSLSWLTPLDPTDTTSPYHPSHRFLAAADLRFDFNGALLAPSVARALPTDLGLHHHAAAPEAAGYTIPELAVTARSSVAAQRCVAYQTLGRVLYRLGKGEFGVEKGRQRTEMDGPVAVVGDPDAESGDEEDDVGSAMAAGLWGCVEEGRVIETLTEEANRTKGHLTARTFAQEALWNWRRGGGRMRPAV